MSDQPDLIELESIAELKELIQARNSALEPLMKSLGKPDHPALLAVYKETSRKLDIEAVSRIHYVLADYERVMNENAALKAQVSNLRDLLERALSQIDGDYFDKRLEDAIREMLERGK